MSTAATADRLVRRGAAAGSAGVTRLAWCTEVRLFALAYATYTLARWLFVGDLAEAREHARWVYELEQSAHVAIEGPLQRALDSPAASWLLSNLYLAAHLVVFPGALIWLYRRSPGVYRELRNTILATWLIAVPVFALFPVAPPRLTDLGLVDTVSRQAAVGLAGRSTIFYNPLAAVPSLHVGFAVAVGVALALALRPRWARRSPCCGARSWRSRSSPPVTTTSSTSPLASWSPRSDSSREGWSAASPAELGSHDGFAGAAATGRSTCARGCHRGRDESRAGGRARSDRGA